MQVVLTRVVAVELELWTGNVEDVPKLLLLPEVVGVTVLVITVPVEMVETVKAVELVVATPVDEVLGVTTLVDSVFWLEVV